MIFIIDVNNDESSTIFKWYDSARFGNIALQLFSRKAVVYNALPYSGLKVILPEEFFDIEMKHPESLDDDRNEGQTGSMLQ